jgi:hypothetical protein
MDAASLAVGIVSLAALFSACVDCFELIESRSSYGRDSIILLAKFDIQILRFLHWGQIVGLVGSSGDPCSPVLGDRDTKQTIESILNCIKLLFTDAEAMKTKYGLRPVPEFAMGEAMHPGNLPAARLSTDGIARFRASFAKFMSGIENVQRRGTMLGKTRWAIHDKTQFAAIVTDVRHLIQGLLDIVPQAVTTEPQLLKSELRSLSAENLRLVQEACVNDYPQLAEVASVQLATTSLNEFTERTSQHADEVDHTLRRPVNGNSVH